MEMKISRKEAKILKLQNDDLEKKLKEHCKAQYRAKFEPRFNKYRAFFLRCFYTSTIAVIVCSIIVFRVINLYYDTICLKELRTLFFILFLGSMFFCFLPYYPLHLSVFFTSRIAKRLYVWKHAKKFFRKIDRIIDLGHHCTNMMLVSQTNVQLEYFTDRSQILSRKALLKVLRLTNIFLRDNLYVGLTSKQKRLFAQMIEKDLKELNGSLIVTYKGKVPKYVSDAFEQISYNLVELRKGEVVV